MRTPSHHLPSLDAFRGLTIAGMILVNNPGDWNTVFEPLVHAEWNGCTVADLVFPSFLLILGVAMPLAFKRRKGRGDSDRQLYWRIGRRTAALIGLGLLLNVVGAWPDVPSLRIPGVLQRIALVYAATALIALHVPPRRRALVVMALLLGHWFVLARFSVHGLVPGDNLAAAIDEAVFGRHLLTMNGDPEGLLGTLSAIATAVVGTLIGESFLARRRSVANLAAWGALLTAVGYAWSFVLPLNKSLWTGSYALFAAGLATIGLVVFHALLDNGHMPDWAGPLTWLGVNPLALYFASELVRQLLDRPILDASGQVTPASWLFWNIVRPATPAIADERWVALAYATLVVAAWTGVAKLMYRVQFRIQV